jgi:gentisate 1,2-dioxygenase
MINSVDLVDSCSYHEYTKAVDPILAGTISRVPFAEFSSDLYKENKTCTIPLDISKQLGCEGPATSPSLCANFVKILAGECINHKINATSQVFYIMHGLGRTEFDGLSVPWKTGDFVALPAVNNLIHFAQQDSLFYLVHDEPLLHYLGVKASTKRFKPTLYTSEETLEELRKIKMEGENVNRNRISVILANKAIDQTLSITHTLWTMLGVLPKGAVQLPHRHQSVALDLILDCQPGCYTLVGTAINSSGGIINPTRVDWKSNSAFITPPGYWHAHFNESNCDANFIPIQDAGLQNYLRTLDIKFTLPNATLPTI